MFKQELKNKYEFLTNYFEGAINNTSRALAHSILFYGGDITAQYELAQEIARILNCTGDKTPQCDCINCKWANQSQHPAILTISKNDNKPPDDESKTVISIKQSNMIKHSLVNSSDYHRVFIFCDKTEEGEILGLNEKNFQAEVANSLLKSIEEPPANTTFFFLTRDKNDLIETIISRSQSFFVPNLNRKISASVDIDNVFEDYPNLVRAKSFDLAQELFELSKESTADDVLNSIQEKISALAQSNIENTLLKTKFIKDFETVEGAKKQLRAKLNPLNVFEDLCLNLSLSMIN